MANLTFGAITTGVQTVTATGAVTPTAGLDISSATIKDWTAFIEVTSLTAAKNARIQLETSTDGTNYYAFHVFDVLGSVTSAADKTDSKRKYQAPSTPVGTSSATMRANVTGLDGGATLKLRAWLEY